MITKLAIRLEPSGDKDLPYYVRPMHKEDVAQVTEIDREAFPSQWPPPNYQHELQSGLAHYVVACDSDRSVEQPEAKAPPGKDGAGLIGRLKRLFSGQSGGVALAPASWHYILGFAGFWVMAEEAHITSIAVREAYRRRGIGELLLISAIEVAMKFDICIVTLEVRVSNLAAQSLYTRYDFTKVGIRRGYYTDNREDAWIMSTGDITSAAFRAHLQQLKQAYLERWGATASEVAR